MSEKNYSYKDLVALLNRYAKAYYVDDDPIVTDSEYDRLYPRDRCPCAVCGDVPEEIHAAPLQCSGGVSPADHNELRGARSRADQCAGRV